MAGSQVLGGIFRVTSYQTMSPLSLSAKNLETLASRVFSYTCTYQLQAYSDMF